MTTFSPFSILFADRLRTHCSASIFPRLEPPPQKHASYIYNPLSFYWARESFEIVRLGFQKPAGMPSASLLLSMSPSSSSSSLDFAAA